MDTRTKIVPFESLGALIHSFGDDQECVLVPGLFDPLTAVHARRLEQYAHGKKLAVVVLDEPGTLLNAASRSELLAALRMVSVVSIAGLDAWRKASFDCETIAYDEAADRRITSDFIELVALRSHGRRVNE